MLRNADFRLLWFGETSSRFGTAVTSVALPLLAVTQLGASSFLVGVLGAAAYLPWLLISLHAGVWVDRLPKRPIMLSCNVLSGLLFLSVPVAAWFGVLTMTQLLVVTFAAGCSTVVFVTAYRAFVPLVVQDLVAANARLQGGEQSAQIAGRGLGGLLVQLAGPATTLLADVTSFCVSTLCLLRIRTDEPPRRASRRSVRHEISEGVRFVLNDPYLRTLSLFSAIGNLAFTALQTLQVVFLVRDVGATPGVIGLAAAAISIGGVLGAAAAPASARRLGTVRAMLVWALGTGPFALLIPLTSAGPGLLCTGIGTLAVGAGLVAITVIMVSFRQSYCPPHLLGRVSATMQVANSALVPLGTLAAGALGSVAGNRAALWVVGVLFALYGLVLLPHGSADRHPQWHQAGRPQSTVLARHRAE